MVRRLQNDFLKLDNDAKCYIEKISLMNSEIHDIEESGQSSGNVRNAKLGQCR